jgi:hypothetical protein
MFVNQSGQNDQSLYRTFHRCFLPSFDSFGRAISEEKIFKNRPIRNKNCLWWPCLLMDQDEMSNLYRGPSIDASYQVSFGWGVSEEKIKMWKVNGRRTPSDGKSSLCLWQGELKTCKSLLRFSTSRVFNGWSWVHLDMTSNQVLSGQILWGVYHIITARFLLDCFTAKCLQMFFPLMSKNT